MDYSNQAIAIDGPAGAGKSSIAQLVAKSLSMRYVDTGAIYRGLTYLCLKAKVDLTQETSVENFLQTASIQVIYHDEEQLIIGNEENITPFLRTEDISQGASLIGTYACVREKLLSTQRDIARDNLVVMDGRDIGTVVLPEAKLKVYLTASPRVRAIRRLLQLNRRLTEELIQEQMEDIITRDKRDMERKIAPLKRSEDAIVIDSSNMSVEDVVKKVVGEYQKNENC